MTVTAADVVRAVDAALEARIEDRADTRDLVEVVTTADPDAFAAAGIVDVIAHRRDVAPGLGVEWAPPAGWPKAAAW